jgi:hypothetical protein
MNYELPVGNKAGCGSQLSRRTAGRQFLMDTIQESLKSQFRQKRQFGITPRKISGKSPKRFFQPSIFLP